MKCGYRYSFYALSVFLMFFVPGCGKDLSRGKAEEILKKNVAPLYEKCFMVQRDNQQVCTFVYDMDRYGSESDIGKLREKGFVVVRGSGFNLFNGNISFFEFTDKAKPYVGAIEQQRSNSEAKPMALVTARVDSIDVTGIAKPSQTDGRTVSIVEYTVHYKPTPMGEALLKPKASLSWKQRARFVLYDDGWRLEGYKVVGEAPGGSRYVGSESPAGSQAKEVPAPPSSGSTGDAKTTAPNVPSSPPDKQNNVSPQVQHQNQPGKSPRWPFTATRLVVEDDLKNLSKSDLLFMRNEIYARHGRVFARKELQEYFDRQPWYQKNPNFKDTDVTALEKQNVSFIKRHE